MLQSMVSPSAIAAVMLHDTDHEHIRLLGAVNHEPEVRSTLLFDQVVIGGHVLAQ
jgi:hypothetical protein